MPFPPIGDIFAPGASGILLYVLGVLVVPVAIGLTVKDWTALGIVFVLWSGLMLLGAAVGWLDATDDLSTGGKLAGSVLVILLPAEAITGAAILLGRSIRRVPPVARQSGSRAKR